MRIEVTYRPQQLQVNIHQFLQFCFGSEHQWFTFGLRIIIGRDEQCSLQSTKKSAVVDVHHRRQRPPLKWKNAVLNSETIFIFFKIWLLWGIFGIKSSHNPKKCNFQLQSVLLLKPSQTPAIKFQYLFYTCVIS